MAKRKGHVYLIGFMGCGKSTVSRFLADRLGMPGFDTDIRIENEQDMRISDIFEQYGEEYFRGLEKSLLEDISNEKNCIVACGGGMAVLDSNIELMKKSGVVVMLTARPETILERVSFNDNRPILSGHKDIEYISELMSDRLPYYERAADIVIDTDEKNPREIAEEIARIINVKPTR